MTEAKETKESKRDKVPGDFVILAKPTDENFLSILQDHLQLFKSILVIVPPKTKLSFEVLQTLMCLELVCFYHISPETKQCDNPPTKDHVVSYDCILLWETDTLLTTSARDVVYDIVREIPSDSSIVFGFVQEKISSLTAQMTDRFMSTPRETMIANYLQCYRHRHKGDEGSDFLASQCTEWLKRRV